MVACVHLYLNFTMIVAVCIAHYLLYPLLSPEVGTSCCGPARAQHRAWRPGGHGATLVMFVIYHCKFPKLFILFAFALPERNRHYSLFFLQALRDGSLVSRVSTPCES